MAWRYSRIIHGGIVFSDEIDFSLMTFVIPTAAQRKPVAAAGEKLRQKTWFGPNLLARLFRDFKRLFLAFVNSLYEFHKRKNRWCFWQTCFNLLSYQHMPPKANSLI